MSLEGNPRQLLEDIRYRRGFPPRREVERIRNEMTVRGLGNSGALVAAITDAYLNAIESVLDEFTEIMLDRRAAFNLAGERDVRAVVAEAHQEVFTFARGAVLDELRGFPGAFGNLATGRIDDRRSPFWEHLERTIKLRPLVKTEPQREPVKEREQKFGILLSAGQAAKDFAAWSEEARKWENPISVLFIDLDHFKSINERYGEVKIDETVLPEAQKLLAKHAQGRGEGYRYGGEEFVIILPNHDRHDAESFAEKLRAAFQQHPFNIEDKVEQVTVSIGLAVWPEHGETYPAVLKAANDAEREAKRSRNAIRVVGF